MNRFDEAAANHAAHAAAKAARKPERDLDFRQEFVAHLEALSKAVDRTQPLAHFEGNFSALHALVTLKAAAESILADVEKILDNKEGRTAASKRVAADRKARGEKPAFMRKRGG